MQELQTNVLIWVMFMSSSMNAAFLLGPNYLANLQVEKNTNFGKIRCSFGVARDLVLEHSEEILNVNMMESASSSWTRSVLSHDQAIQWTTAKVRAYSASVQC